MQDTTVFLRILNDMQVIECCFRDRFKMWRLKTTRDEKSQCDMHHRDGSHGYICHLAYIIMIYSLQNNILLKLLVLLLL